LHFTLTRRAGGTGSGFTLVELLVVIAIIAVLIAMLTPALETAIYQAELAVCGSRLKAAGSGVTVYTFDFKRAYPYRAVVRDFTQFAAINQTDLAIIDPAERYDDRKPLKGYVSVNGALQCPLSAELDLEIDSSTDTTVISHYTMWWNWQFRTAASGWYRGMVRLGDGFEWDGTITGGDAGRYTVLISDALKRNAAPNLGKGSHQDKHGVWDPHGPYQSEGAPVDPENPGSLGGLVLKSTVFYWRANGKWRGPIDVNYGMSDGSVARYNDVQRNGERKAGLKLVPQNRDPDLAQHAGNYAIPPN
jgi:prepilin-type N-terminal cleavage/methylation domain-containing protein